MASKSRDLFLTIRSEGAILPPDLLQRIVSGDRELYGLKPDDYHLPKSEKLNEATSRSWNRLLGAWSSFRPAAEKLPESELGNSLTRERWLLPLFQELGYGRLLTAKAIEADGKSYAISHGWNRTPIHLLGCRVDLDRPQQRTATTSRSSPHSLLQETLNRSKEHLWGFVTNGLKFRVLRDNASLTRQAYVEFDLEAMMLGENYADFVLLWLLCHQSRVESENPPDCWLEKWSQASKERGVRALDQLRRGVEQAITALGRGFLSCQVNRKLREDLRTGALDPQDYYRQLLRLVYRLLFLFSAEDRGLLLMPGDANAAARERYLTHYSTSRLRRMAERRTGTRHTDLFASLRLIMAKLGLDAGCPELALPALGSFLFSERALPDLENCDISNFDLSEAFRALAVTVSNGIRRPVDYKNLGAEELGSVYESLLELHPRVNLEAASFELSVASGHERKTTGSYYTPTSLIDCLLDSALEPVLGEASRKPEPEKAILGLKVVDPACGSGHFLIAAAHRIAKRLATARTGDEEPSPEAVRTALRDVIGHCIYGVDINPMAVELCKVNLWMEALEPGKPLSFLESKIQCGNALLGTAPTLLNDGIPDTAFAFIEGDSREACTKWKKVNKAERTSRARKQGRFDFDAPWMKLGKFAESFLAVDHLGDESIEQIHQKEMLYEQAVRSGDYLDGRFLADAWCAAFVWNKSSLLEFPITEEVFRQIEQNPTAFYNDKRGMTKEIRDLAEQYQFLHWHLVFPDVFRPAPTVERSINKRTGWDGGFDVVLGNPPWEKLQTEELQFFAVREPHIAAMVGADRKRAILALRDSNPRLASAWEQERRFDSGVISFVRNSNRFPLTAVGKFNTYALFAELAFQCVGPTGRLGCIIPSGIATDDTTKLFFQEIVESERLVSLYDFENREGIFESVHRSYKFCLLTVTGGMRRTATGGCSFVFFATRVAELADPERRFQLSRSDIKLMNPNTLTCPTFRTSRDASLNAEIYRRVPIFLSESDKDASPYHPEVWRLVNTTDDHGGFTFLGSEELGPGLIPVIEAKLIHQFDHRYASFRSVGADMEISALSDDQKASPDCEATARYYMKDGSFRNRLPESLRDREWFLTVRNVARSTDERTVIAAIIPRGASSEHTPYVEVAGGAQTAAFLCAVLNSFALDYIARQKVGGINLSYFIFYQLAVLHPKSAGPDIREELLRRVLELTYTSHSLLGFAAALGYQVPPFLWNGHRRTYLKCEIDARIFLLYGMSRTDVDHIMDTFTIVRRKDAQQFGEYRTKRLILEIFDAMAEAETSGVPYQTVLDPPPADPRVAHGVLPLPTTVLLQAEPVDLSAIAAGAWAASVGITPDNLALLTLVEVMRAFGGNASQVQVRLAATLVRKPAHVLAFLEDEQAREWVRAVGNEARPLPANVVNISQFRPTAADLPWSNAVAQLTATGGMSASADRWVIAGSFPASSGESWIAGRAAFAVDLVSRMASDEAEQRMVSFLRSVEDGTAARRAVS